LVGPNGAPNYTVAYAGTGQSEMVSKGQDAYTYNAYGTFYYVREPDGNLIGQRVTGRRTYYYLGRS
jgi:multidrug efflux pump subunit AcrA (membrane-fusion protein)